MLHELLTNAMLVIWKVQCLTAITPAHMSLKLLQWELILQCKQLSQNSKVQEEGALISVSCTSTTH